MKSSSFQRTGWTRIFPPSAWLAEYKQSWLRQVAIGPTSAISLMIAGSVGALAGGDAIRFAQIASLSAFAVAVLCLIAWLFKLSILVRVVSDSILVGFKAGAGLTIIMSQLPSL